MKVLLIHGPRPYWPFVHEQDNYLVPQGLVCLAAAVRKAGMDVRIVDSMPLKIGYQSLAKLILEYRPDVIGVGENHALYASEALKVCQLAKTEMSHVQLVVGGTHFSHTLETTLFNPDVDFVVVGEGERSFVNLLNEMASAHPNYRRVRGIAFHSRQLGDYEEKGALVINDPEPLIQDLDGLGLPAYDLLPMELYGQSKYLYSPGGTTIHHGRGCPGGCSFCAFWLQMADRKYEADGTVKLIPRYRTKSAQLTVDEVELLVKKYKKRALVFVDDSFNLDPRWNDQFSEEMIRRNLKVNIFAFMRADLILRDEKLGIMEKLVRAGLRHVCIGVERVSDTELKGFNKSFYSEQKSQKAIALLKSKYPEVFIQATFIVGLREETRESILEVGRLARELNVDFPAFHPMTPVPGTALWNEALAGGWLETMDFNEFDWSTPVMPSKYLSREEIQELMHDLIKDCMRSGWFLKGVMSPHSYRRRMYLWWSMVSLKIGMSSIAHQLNPFDVEHYHKLVYPKWYSA